MLLAKFRFKRRDAKAQRLINFFEPLCLCVSVFIFFCTSGCGYHFGRGELGRLYNTVSVPFVEGDHDGIFTATLVRALTVRGELTYKAAGADLMLKVGLLEPSDTNIGYIYAPPDKGDDEASNIVVSNEARLSIGARVILIDRCTGCYIFGPIEIRNSLDYDFEPDLGNSNDHAFSLGQLEMHNLAQDATLPSLYAILAEKIVDYINNSW